jgi:Fe-S-cluster containining protein
MPRKRFDERLAEGKGPPEVRMQDNLYYVHGKVCPAYRERLCAVYDSDVKPSGCTDFPIYVDDDGGLLADLRCEALSVLKVEAALRESLPPGVSFRRREHPEFPFLITFRVAAGRTAGRSAPGRRRQRRA